MPVADHPGTGPGSGNPPVSDRQFFFHAPRIRAPGPHTGTSRNKTGTSRHPPLHCLAPTPHPKLHLPPARFLKTRGFPATLRRGGGGTPHLSAGPAPPTPSDRVGLRPPARGNAYDDRPPLHRALRGGHPQLSITMSDEASIPATMVSHAKRVGTPTRVRSGAPPPTISRTPSDPSQGVVPAEGGTPHLRTKEGVPAPGAELCKLCMVLGSPKTSGMQRMAGAGYGRPSSGIRCRPILPGSGKFRCRYRYLYIIVWR